MIKYFIDENIFEIITKPDNNEDNKQINLTGERPQLKEENDKDKFLFNYSLLKNMVINHETRAFLFKYYSSSINILELYPEIFYCFAKHYIPPKNYHKKRSYYQYNIGRAKKEFKSIEFCYKVYLQVNNLKNKELVKSLNPFYYKIYEFIEFMYFKSMAYLGKLNVMESKIFRFYITLFIFKKIPFILKKLIYNPQINNDSFSLDSLIKENEVEDYSRINEIEAFIILALLEIKGENILSIKEYFPEFFNIIQNQYNKFKELKIPEIDINQQPDENFIEGMKYLLANDMQNFMNNLKHKFSFYKLIFILEKKNNILDNELSSEKDYLEKIIYKLLNGKLNDLSSEKNVLNGEMNETKIFISSLNDFKKFSLNSFTENKKQLSYDNYKKVLLFILSICNYILRKFANNNEYKLNIFNLKEFLHAHKEKLDQMAKTISITNIKNHILSLYLNNNKLRKYQDNFDDIIKNWLDDYLNSKYIKEIFSELEKENSSFIKYLKYLKINCNILYNFIRKIQFLYSKYRNINAYYIKTKDKDKSLENLKNSLMEITKNLNDSYKTFNEEPINISYYFNEEEGDYSETCTNLNLYFFLDTKVKLISRFKYNLFYKKYKKNKRAYDKLLFVEQKINNKNINFIINEYWNHCFFNNDIFNIDEFFEKYKDLISLYFGNTSSDIFEPNIDRCIIWIRSEMQKIFFNEIYPILYFNYNLYSYYKDLKKMDSLFGYKNVINSNIIISLLKQKGYYIPNSLEKSRNLKKFVKEICNQGPIFSYENYFDFTELIKAIKETKFHNNIKCNSLFQIRAINYIINGDSLIHIFIDELIKLLYHIDKKKLNRMKSISFKVCDKIGKSSSLNNSKSLNIQKENKEKKINESKSNTNVNIFKNVKKITKTKLKLKVDKNEKIHKESIYNNNEIYYKFPGLPISGYSGYIPKKKFFYGISNDRIIKMLSNNGVYLNDYKKEEEYDLFKKNIIKKNDEKKNLDSVKYPLIEKEQKYNIIKKQNIVKSMNNKFDFFFDDNFINKNINGAKKSVYSILKKIGNCELKKSIEENIIKKVIAFEFYKKNDNFKESIFSIHDKKWYFIKNNSKRHHYYKKENLINVFDSLFSIRKVGYIIEVMQNDISEIIKPNMNIEDFENLINQSLQPKAIIEIPENWKTLLSLNNIYPAFRLNKLLEDNINDEHLGMVKLHKNY